MLSDNLWNILALSGFVCKCRQVMNSIREHDWDHHLNIRPVETSKNTLAWAIAKWSLVFSSGSMSEDEV